MLPLSLDGSLSLSLSLDISDGRLVWRKFQLGLYVEFQADSALRIECIELLRKKRKHNENFRRDSERLFADHFEWISVYFT